ncbi:hypothetical protein FBT69_12670 [Synechococcales cyanobacterium CNB]|nr:hypothetical protein [Phycisphaerales bacterium]MDL1905644.1 hypothetical protein [Synechococcales cyanobacterium CNB]
MPIKVPGVAAVMLFVMGVFQATAAFACFIPSFVHDRVPEQFVPVWRFLTRPIYGDTPNEAVIKALAVASQVIIGTTEAFVSAMLLGAALVPRRRRALAHLGLSASMLLYTAFMLTMYAMHDKSLPNWNQYPAILAWIGVTWTVVALESKTTV